MPRGRTPGDRIEKLGASLRARQRRRERKTDRFWLGRVFGTRTVVEVISKEYVVGGIVRERLALRVRCECGDHQVVEPHQAEAHPRCWPCSMAELYGVLR